MWFGGISIIYLVLTQNMKEGRTVYRYSDVQVEGIGDGGGVRVQPVTDRDGIVATQTGGIDYIHYEGGCEGYTRFEGWRGVRYRGGRETGGCDGQSSSCSYTVWRHG